jgi:hypothetical protein
MAKGEFMKAAKISLAMFAGYVALTELMVYLDCVLFGCEPPYRAFSRAGRTA